MDFTLEPGQVTQEVRVTGEAPLLETENATLSSVVENKQIDSMPTVGRNPLEFALFVPGVRASGSFGAIPVSAYGGGRVAVAGGPVSANANLVDGMAAEMPSSGGMLTPFSVDATEEFRVITHDPSAEYGRTGGGIMVLTSKSGTNEIHGDLYEFDQNTDLSANNYFNKAAGKARSPLHFNEWGATAGGPIKKNKTFFFFNYEGFSLHSFSTATRTVPTDLERQGDFSQTLTASGAAVNIYDPNSTQPDPANPGSYIRTQFPGNKIPAGRISAIAQAIQKYFPEPNTAGVANTQTNNFFAAAAGPEDSKVFGLRMDHYLTPTRRLAGRYTWGRVSQVIPNFFNNIAEPQTSSLNYTRNSSFVSYTDAFSAAKFLDLRAGFNIYQPRRVSRSYGFDQTSLGFPSSLNSDIQVPTFPYITNSDVSQLGITGDQLIQSGKVLSYLGSFTWIAGRHNLKFGSANAVYQFNNTQNGVGILFGFTRGFTQGPNPNTSGAASGFGYASFLLGTPSSGNVGYGAMVTETTKNEALYVQDDWKILRTLTLNLGMRWEYEGGTTDRFNKISNFNPNVTSQVNGLTLTGGLQFPGVNGVSRGARDAEWTDYQPRLAFAWQLIPKTVLRGGTESRTCQPQARASAYTAAGIR